MIKSKREEQRLTQEELASKIGVTKSYMCKLEKHPENCNPTINVILKLSNELNMSPINVFIYFLEKRMDQDS